MSISYCSWVNDVKRHRTCILWKPKYLENETRYEKLKTPSMIFNILDVQKCQQFKNLLTNRPCSFRNRKALTLGHEKCCWSQLCIYTIDTTCEFCQIDASLHLQASSFIKLIKSVKIRLDATCYLHNCRLLLRQLASNVWLKSLDIQLAWSLLQLAAASWSKHQHNDGKASIDLLRLARFWSSQKITGWKLIE